MYFFRGRQYIRFDFAKGKKDDGYPLSVSANWRGLQGPFDAVLMGTGDRKDKVYFFQDHRYWRYDLKTHRTDRGYPKDTRPLWPGLGFSIAEQAIRAFEQKSTPGKWPRLSRAILAQEMRDTLEDPWRINQASTPMCGPACILYGLAGQRPRDYVRLVADLYDKGSHRMKTKTMRPSADVMGSAASHGTRQVDWLTMAGMRDAANVIFTIDGNEGGSQNIEQGIAFPWEIEGWAKELLRLRNVKVDTTFVWGDEEILQKGDLAHRRGGISILLVDAAMARNESAFPAVPNHYVVYEGNLDIERRPFWQGDMYRFRVWTWGTRPRGIAQKDSHFDGNMFGAIYGDP